MTTSAAGRPPAPPWRPLTGNTDNEPVILGIPERLGYRIKCALLGKPLVTQQLSGEKLTKTTALGVLSSDCISSAAYGTEEMLIALLVVFGLSGFHILLPMTLAVLAVLILMTLSYREVVMVYTRAGGSYVVARDNFGPKVAQIASVALLIDYIVTVAVQASAGTAAITSLVPGLNPYTLEITVAAVLILAVGNLRGIREAGKAFALPTYLFVLAAGTVVIVGVIRSVLGDLPTVPLGPGTVPVLDLHHQILSGAAIFVLLKAFANGGSSLTGLEAISNGVSAFHDPRGPNARRTLSTMSLLLGFLVAGISYLAFRTHATPYESGTPTVISQVARAAFGGSWSGHAGFVIVQIATALILFTGANTPFTGFPFLASFIAEDSFLPRQLTRRGHRLAFSNGIIVLTVLALALLLGVGAHVDKLVPFYAIGVFTGFTMAGFGMAKYHSKKREPGWRHKLAVNFAGGAVSLLIVLIFAVVKFTEGAWLVVLLFPIGWYVLMRLNRRYAEEAHALRMVSGLSAEELPVRYPRHVVLLMVDRLDLAVLRAIRYAGSLRPTDFLAVHIELDSQAADALEREWIARGLGEATPLQMLECADRRLVRCISDKVLSTVVSERAEVTVLLPRRIYRGLSRRILHDRTADRIAAAIGRVEHASATIVPFDTTLSPHRAEELEDLRHQIAAEPQLVPVRAAGTARAARSRNGKASGPRPAPDPGSTPIARAGWREEVTVVGRIEAVQPGTVGGKSLEAHVFDSSGGIRLLFFGRTQITGIDCGTRIRASGRVGEFKGKLALANPRYELLPPDNGESG